MGRGEVWRGVKGWGVTAVSAATSVTASGLRRPQAGRFGDYHIILLYYTTSLHSLRYYYSDSTTARLVTTILYYNNTIL